MVGTYPKGIDPALIHLTGTVVTWWGRIEGILVYDLITLRQQPVAKAYATKRPFPVSSRRVIEQWGDLRKIVFADKPAKLLEAKDILSELQRCAPLRHAIVHGFWPYGAEGDGDRLRLQSIKTAKGSHDSLEIAETVINVGMLDRLNDDLVHLYHRVMVSGLQLFFGPDSLPKPAIPADPQP